MSKQVIEIITNLSKGKYLTLNGKPVSLSEVSDIMNAQKKEIEKLKEKIENIKMFYETDAEAKYYDFVNKHESKLQQRIDKAIDYIDAKAHHGDCIIPTTILELKNKDYYKLIDILKGEDKE